MILKFVKFDSNDNEQFKGELPVDDRFADLQITIPEKKIEAKKSWGQGSIIENTPFFSNRVISFNYRFKAKNGQIFTIERDDFFNNWLFTNDIVYLYRQSERGEQRIRGHFKISEKEKYKKYAISDDIAIDFITEKPFFENLTEKKYSGSVTYGYVSFLIENTGNLTSFFVKISNNSFPFTALTIKYLGQNLKISGFNYTKISDILFLDFVNFKFYLNEEEFFPILDGNPFFLTHGQNLIEFEVNFKKHGGALDFWFYEKFI